MNIKSEKEFYGYKFEKMALRFNADIFVWGEELIDKKLIIYPKKLKDVFGFQDAKDDLEPCGLVLIDTCTIDCLHFVSATVNTANGNLYITESSFNSSWRLLKNSVRIGINIANQNGGSPIENPEEILVLDNLRRPGSTPTIVNNAVKYKAKELTDEEKHRNSRKQSLLDNPRKLYFYENNGKYYHDKDCVEVKLIAPETFTASEEIPNKKICPKCERLIYIRKACYPNTKQMGVCDKILKGHDVSLGKIRHCVMEAGMKFHATSIEELQVEGVEDTWIVKGLYTNSLTLWHNNYVKTGPTERYITEGFHKQKVGNKSLTQLLTYIESYSFVKHLEKENRSSVIIDNPIIDYKKDKIAQKNKIPNKLSIFDIFKSFINKIKKIFNIR